MLCLLPLQEGCSEIQAMPTEVRIRAVLSALTKSRKEGGEKFKKFQRHIFYANLWGFFFPYNF